MSGPLVRYTGAALNRQIVDRYQAGATELEVARALRYSLQHVIRTLWFHANNYAANRIQQGFATLRDYLHYRVTDRQVPRRFGGHGEVDTRRNFGPSPMQIDSGSTEIVEEIVEPSTPRYPAGSSKSYARLGTMSGSLGVLQGRWKRPKIDQVDRRGSEHITQQHGVIESNYCVWFGVEAMVSRQVCVDIGVAFIRYWAYELFKREYHTRLAKISVPVTGTPSHDPFYKIELYSEKVEQTLQGAISPTIYKFAEKVVVDLSVHDFGIWFADDVCGSNIWKTDHRDANKLAYMNIVSRTTDASGSTYSEQRIDLSTFRVVAGCETDVIIQNATMGGDGSTSILDVEANPIVGRRYKFSDPTIMIRDPGGALAWDALMRTDGVGATGPFKNADGMLIPGQPPDNWRRFDDIKGYTFTPDASMSNFTLYPGQIKTRWALDFGFEGTLSAFLKNLHQERSSGAVDLLDQRKALGSIELYAFEPKLPAMSETMIPALTIHYCVNRKYVAYCKSGLPVLLPRHNGVY